MVNLLPTPLKARRARVYYIRLVTVLAIGLSIVTVLATALLVPTYLLAQSSAEASGRYLAALEEAVGLKEKSADVGEVTLLGERARAVAALATPAMVNPVIDEVVSAKSSSIRLTELSVSRDTGAVSVTGVATTRTALLTFVDQLRATHDLSDVALPVSALVPDKNIDFTLSATHHPTP